jgi:serine/threonine-protein kinase RIO1
MPINFPIDFRPIGFNYVMDAATFDRLNDTQVNTDWLYDQIQIANDADVHVAYIELDDDNYPIYEFRIGSTITINGVLYTITRRKGRGSYGMCAEVQNPEGQTFCLKRQFIRELGEGVAPGGQNAPNLGPTNELYPLKEAIIHYILFRQTVDPTNISLYVPNMYQIARSADNTCVYFLTELMTNTFKYFLHTSTDRHQKAKRIMAFFAQMTPKLCYLYNLCRYNHGDFKPDNVMFTGRHYKLIDFGFSRLELEGGRSIQTTPKNSRSITSRDITQMAHYLADTYNLSRWRAAGAPNFPTRYVARILQKITDRALCRGELHVPSSPHEPRLMRPDAHGNYIEWGDLYRWLNRHDNIYGNYRSMELFISDYNTVMIQDENYRITEEARNVRDDAILNPVPAPCDTPAQNPNAALIPAYADQALVDFLPVAAGGGYGIYVVGVIGALAAVAYGAFMYWSINPLLQNGGRTLRRHTKRNKKYKKRQYGTYRRRRKTKTQS